VGHLGVVALALLGGFLHVTEFAMPTGDKTIIF
jgi:hypothetical protein